MAGTRLGHDERGRPVSSHRGSALCVGRALSQRGGDQAEGCPANGACRTERAGATWDPDHASAGLRPSFRLPYAPASIRAGDSFGRLNALAQGREARQQDGCEIKCYPMRKIQQHPISKICQSKETTTTCARSYSRHWRWRAFAQAAAMTPALGDTHSNSRSSHMHSRMGIHSLFSRMGMRRATLPPSTATRHSTSQRRRSGLAATTRASVVSASAPNGANTTSMRSRSTVRNVDRPDRRPLSSTRRHRVCMPHRRVVSIPPLLRLPGQRHHRPRRTWNRSRDLGFSQTINGRT